MILALDTATDFPSLALGTAADPGAELRLADRRALSRDIARVTAELCRARGIAVPGVAGVVVADGPGSFTGLRIGAAFAKGLARALGVPLYAAPSLLGAAAGAADRAGCARPLEVEVRYDALRGQCYRAVYRITADGAEVLAAPALAPSGDAVATGGAIRASETDASAAALLRLLGRLGGPLVVAEPAGWQPDYGRPAEAEARRLAGGGGPAAA